MGGFRRRKSSIILINGGYAPACAELRTQEMNIQTLREKIETSIDPYPLQLSYLTGARANELCAPGREEMYTHMQRPNEKFVRVSKTHSVGPLARDCSFDVFENQYTGEKVRVFKIEMTVLKRREKFVVKRIVAFPIGEYEPWTIEIAKHVQALQPNEPILDMERHTLTNRISRAGFYASLKEEDKVSDPHNPLRHYRLTHLIDNYAFDPYQIRTFFGWSPNTTLKASGGSSISRKYEHLNWGLYFPKLCKPLPITINKEAFLSRVEREQDIVVSVPWAGFTA